MTARITAPVKGLNGTGVGGIRFVNSVAETDNESVIAYCRAAGYEVQDLEAAPTESELPEGEPTESWKNDQIKAWAKANDRDLGGATNKADMLAALAAPAQ